MAHIQPIGGFSPEKRSDEIIQAIVDNNQQVRQIMFLD